MVMETDNFDVLTSLDVAARNRSCYLFKYNKLSLSKESGAMNEAFSDIWGACVEYYAAPSKSTWLIGEDIMKTALL
jgi:Zn-dependent metalloprotease